MTTKCNYDCNENGLSLNYFSFSLQSLPQDGVEINARPFPVLVILLVIRIKHHNLSISCILRRMAGEGRLLSAGHISVLRWAPAWSATTPAMGQICWKPGHPRRLPILPPGLESEPMLLSHRSGTTAQLPSEKRPREGFAHCEAPFKHKGGRRRGPRLPNEKDLSALPGSTLLAA